MKYQRAVHGDTFAQTEAECCPACGRANRLAVAGVEVGVRGFEYGGVPVPLTVCETEVFRALAKSFGEIVHISHLHNILYSADPNGGPDFTIFKVWICKIRQKLKAAAVPLEIKTVWGVGYQLLALPVGN